jgi:hypothetical protein
MPPPPFAAHCVPPPASFSVAADTETQYFHWKQQKFQYNTPTAHKMVTSLDGWVYTTQTH